MQCGLVFTDTPSGQDEGSYVVKPGRNTPFAAGTVAVPMPPDTVPKIISSASDFDLRYCDGCVGTCPDYESLVKTRREIEEYLKKEEKAALNQRMELCTGRTAS